MRSRSNSRSIRMSFPSSSAWPFFHSHDFRGAWEKRDCATAARSRSLDNEPRLYLLVTSSLESVSLSLSLSLSCTQSTEPLIYTGCANKSCSIPDTPAPSKRLCPFIDNDASRENVIRKRDTWPLSLLLFLFRRASNSATRHTIQRCNATYSILFLIVENHRSISSGAKFKPGFLWTRPI